MRILLFLVLLAACDSGVFDQPFVKPPQLTSVTVTVHWTTRAEIERVCKDHSAYGCATVATAELPYSELWLIKPKSFNGALVEAIGHEMLHALGATHQ